jgi:hypothetical protein
MNGLVFQRGAIYTKRYLPPATIDKGRNRRIGYYPDYSVWIDGLLILIIEAKSPFEVVEDGFLRHNSMHMN